MGVRQYVLTHDQIYAAQNAKSSRKKVEIPMSDVLYSTLAELEMTSDYVLPKVAERYQSPQEEFPEIPNAC